MKTKKRFTIEPHEGWMKSFAIWDSEDALPLEVDYDDVNHKVVDRTVKKLVKLMNEHAEDLK